MAKIKVNPGILEKTPAELGPLSFGEIALVLDTTEKKVERIFNAAMGKLKMSSREFHEYVNMDAGETNDKNKTRL